MAASLRRQVVVSPARSGNKPRDGPPVPLAELIAALPSPTYLSSPPAPLLTTCLLSQFSPFTRRTAANSNSARAALLFIGGTKMPEHSENAAENIMSSIMDTIAENLPNKKSVRFDEGSVSDQAQRLFGGKRNVHHVLGGGKPADVLLWRNKKISSSVLAVATAVWIFFEWLDYHFLTIVCFMLVLGMAVQFAWSSFAGMLNGSPSNVPRIELPEEVFANVGAAVGAQVNKVLGALQDVSCGRNLKQFLVVITAFFAAAVIGSWCNFLTVIYIGFVCAHTLPVLYEKYQDQVDDFLYNVLGLLQNQYQKLDKGVLSKVPKGGVKFRKSE